MTDRLTASERESLVARVRVTLAERDAKYSHPDYDREPLETSHLDWRDLRALVTEVELLTRERDAERQAREVTFGWYDERRAEVLRLTAEVERLREAMQKAGQSLADLSDTDAAYLGGWGGLVGTLSHRLLDAARTTGGRDA